MPEIAQKFFHGRRCSRGEGLSPQLGFSRGRGSRHDDCLEFLVCIESNFSLAGNLKLVRTVLIKL